MTSMTDTQRDELLIKLATDVAEVKLKIGNDFKALYGNGKPGLIDTVAVLERRISELEGEAKARKRHWVAICGIIAWVASAAVNLIGAWIQHGR